MNLFKIIFSQKILEIQKELLKTYDEKDSFEKKIEKMIDIHFDFLCKDGRLPLFVINEINSNSEIAKTIKDVFNDTISPFLLSIQKDLDSEIKAGKIRDISAFNLLLNIVSMDVFIFIAEPVMKNILLYSEQEMQEVFIDRKQEIKKAILLSLKK
jgi:hypothetical protein